MAKRTKKPQALAIDETQALRASPLGDAGFQVAEEFGRITGRRMAVNPTDVLVWADLIFKLLDRLRECRAARNAPSDPSEAAIFAAKERRVATVVAARQAAREQFGRFRRREIVDAADAALNVAARSKPETIQSIYDDMDTI